MTKHDNVSQGKIMKATEFVKKHGIEKIKELISIAPESSTLVFHHFDVINSELLGPEYYRDNGSQHFNKDKKSWGFCLDPQIRVVKPHDALESLFDLKRLVESHELIKKDFESVEMAEYEYMISASHDEPYWIRVRQAIADVEACQ